MTLVNQPALFASVFLVCLCLSLIVLAHLENAGLVMTSLRVVFFGCMAAALVLGVVACVFSPLWWGWV